MSADDDLIRRAKEGDPEAWRELYRAHAGRLVVWLSARPSGDAAVSPEDLAAEAWLTAAQKVAEFTGSGDEFAGWLFGIARLLTTNTRRRSRRRVTSPHADPMVVDVVAGPELALDGNDWVVRTLAALPPREREVVACTEIVGLDVESTARALGISAVAVRVARHRALRKLRALDHQTPVPPGHARQDSAVSSRSR